MIKRYDLFQIHPCGHDRRGEMRQTLDGEFVVYEDVKHFLPPLPASRDELFERVAAAIDDADFGYSLQLTRLVDGVREYTLTRSDGGEALTFSDSDEAYQYIRLQKLLRMAAAAIAAMTSTPVDQMEPFQARVQPWMMACFGAMIAGDREERNHRFLEEALELVQSAGCTVHEAHQLVDYVYGRAVGEPHQEVGGVMVTLAALCLANDLDMHQCGETELARIWTKVEAIRAKQAAKPKHSPLPGPSAALKSEGAE